MAFEAGEADKANFFLIAMITRMGVDRTEIKGVGVA